MKPIFKYQVIDETVVVSTFVNEGVVSDKAIQLNSSKQQWRLIQFVAPSGKIYK